MADHWLASPQLLDYSDQRSPQVVLIWTTAIACSRRECPALELFHVLTHHLLLVLAVTHPPLTPPPARHLKTPRRSLPYALGSNASGLAVRAFSAPPAGSMLVWPSAMEGAVLTTGSVTIAVMIIDHD